jgi:uncharacterized protein YerC
MAIYNLISIKEIIRRIVSDTGMSDTDVPWADFIEWIADGLLHIGAYSQFKEKTTDLQVENYRATLPCDFYKEIRMLHNGYYDKPYGNLIAPEGVSEATRSQVINSIKSSTSDYNINGNVITTSYSSGTINLQYLAMPVDEEGFPMIPDDVSYKDALFWKVVYQLSIRGYQFKNPQLRDLNFTTMKWNFYCRQARANANMPTPAEMQSLANNWLRLFPDHNQYYKLWVTNGMKYYNTLRGRR